jgi:hypothetical protein
MDRQSRILATLGLGIVVCLFFVACRKPADLGRAESATAGQVREYVNGPMGRYSDLFSGVVYVGSDSSFDYIAIKQGQRTVKLFRVNRGALGVMRLTAVHPEGKTWVDITKMFPVSNGLDRR